MKKWKPISETPPEDECILLCWGNHVSAPDVGIYCGGGKFQRANDDMEEYDADPTHWVEIPAPPVPYNAGIKRTREAGSA